MSYVELLPAPPLRRHVACYWRLEASGKNAEAAAIAPPRPHRVLPDGAMDILIWLGHTHVEPTVVGAMTTAIVVPATPAEAIGVRFRPGEAFAFLATEAGDLRDATVSPATLGLTGFDDLAEELARTSRATRASRRMGPRPRPFAHVLDAFLLARLARVRVADPRVRHAVALLEETRGALAIGDLARRACVGERQLLRLFDERVGVSPKTLARVVRLQALGDRLDALAVAAPDRAPPWARLAAEAGYADQPHMAREVKRLAGVTPTELYQERMSVSYKPSETQTGQSARLPSTSLPSRLPARSLL